MKLTAPILLALALPVSLRLRQFSRAVPELIESEGIHKEAEAVESALVQDGGSDGLFEGSAGSI
ncbi:MAG: hypothetical protein WBX25_02265, partial [Rhodomicrobium sp.]